MDLARTFVAGCGEPASAVTPKPPSRRARDLRGRKDCCPQLLNASSEITQRQCQDGAFQSTCRERATAARYAYELPDGTEVDLVADDGGDDLTDSERQALHEAVSKSSASAEAGNLRPASAIIEELRRRV